MSAEFRPTSHLESADEILLSHDEGQEILEENKPSEYKSIDETMSTTGSYASTDHSNPVSVEYNYVDDVNPASGYQDIEGSQSEANDYECIAGTNPAYDYIEVITEPRTLMSERKKTILFPIRILASVIVNITVGFLMFLHLPHFRGDSSESRWTVPKALITFGVFFGLAAASCAPLMIRYGIRKVALGGSVLHICSTGFSSLTTTSDILAILFGIMRGIALGLLLTIGIVATVDHLYTRPALALVISYISLTVGNIIGITAIAVGLSHGWDLSHTMRAFEIYAVIGLIASSFLQKNSQTQQNASKLFKHPPFYFLLSIRLAASVGIYISAIFNDSSIVTFIVTHFLVLVGLVIIQIFQREKLNKSALLSMGISVLALGVENMVLGGAFGPPFLLGAATALSQIMLPLALVNTTGRSNLKLVLPLLGCFDEMGRLISNLVLLVLSGPLPPRDDAANIKTSPANGALYFGGVSLITAGVGAIIAWVLIKRWTPLSDESEEEDHVEDRVEEAEDQVEETEDHVGETEGRVGETEDRVGETEDHIEETEDHVEETGDHVEETEDHVEETEDHVEETEDQVEETEDHVEETEDHVEETEDHDGETGDHVEETEDMVEEAEDTGQMETEDPGN